MLNKKHLQLPQGNQTPLFLVAGTDVKAPEVLLQSAETPSAKEETIGEKLQGLWVKAVTVLNNYRATQRELYALENSILNTAPFDAAIDVMDDYDAKKHLIDLSRKLRNRLVRHAEKRFAPIGGKLSIDEEAIGEKFQYDEKTPDAFSLKALWEYLEKSYGGQAGEDRAWQQTAKALIDVFSLKHKNEVIRKGGRTILELSVYINGIDKKFGGKNRLHYNSNGEVLKTLSELKSFAVWQQNMSLAGDLDTLHNKFWHGSHDELVSREKHSCGDNNELVMVTYLNKFEFSFSDACAAQLQLFLGTFGNLNHEE